MIEYLGEMTSLGLCVTVLFILGYVAITCENVTHVSKTAAALLTTVFGWTCIFLFNGQPTETNLHLLTEHLASASQIVFFLIGAMTIVELVDAHHGFEIISDLLTTRSKRKMLWIISVITFFLSAVLDNLTTTIVMISILRKVVKERNERLILGATVVIAANAGGAWTPIGDVTTTMLWIGGQISSLGIMKTLFIPSIVCLAVSVACQSLFLKGKWTDSPDELKGKKQSTPKAGLILALGVGALIFVPIFKTLTHLPPFMGILVGLGVLWVVTDLLYKGESDNVRHLTVPYSLSRIDFGGILFFLGILLAVDTLQVSGVLKIAAGVLDHILPNQALLATFIGMVSAVIDNVPLVAATMRMYDMNVHPIDSPLWNMIAYAAGTGGSLLIIGSAAGVVFMGMEKVDFFWYLKKITLIALVGYFAGMSVVVLIDYLAA